MDYEQAVTFRRTLLADAPTRVRLADDDTEDPTVGTVLPMKDTPDDDLYRQIYGQAGDDVAVMVWVRWSRTHVRPEYVEDLTAIPGPRGT